MALASIALAALAADAAAPTGSASDRPPNLLVVTLDTWRADALSLEGGDAYATPALDALAKRGVHLSHVLTSAPITLPSHASLFTGLYPNRHGVHDNDFSALPASAQTLAEVAAQQGYRTAAVVGAVVLHARSGIAQGYDAYDDDIHKTKSSHVAERSATVVTERALDLMKGMPDDAPWHLWVHYYDAHDPYVAHDGLPPGYAGEVAHLDRNLGTLLAALEKRPDGGRTLVLVVGDHGEGLGDHGETTHGTFLYGSTTRVAALLAGPGVPVGRRVDSWVATVDLLPTIAALLGWPPPDGDGHDLSGLLAGTAPASPRPLFAESRVPYDSFRYAPSHAAIVEGYKVIVSGRKVEVYDAKGTEAEEVTTLPAGKRAKLRSVVETYSSVKAPDAPRQSDAEALAAIQSLGYVGVPAPAPDAASALPAARDRIETIQQVLHAQELLASGKRAEALAILDEVGIAEPTNVRVRVLRSTLALDREDFDVAVALLAPLEKESAYYAGLYHEARGKAAAAKGQIDAARAAFQEALRHDERRMSSHSSLALLLIGRGDVAGALPHFRRARELAPQDPLVAFNLGLALVRAGNGAEAGPALAAAMDLDPAVAGRILKTAEQDRLGGDRTGAQLLLEAYVARNPGDAAATRTLAKLRGTP